MKKLQKIYDGEENTDDSRNSRRGRSKINKLMDYYLQYKSRRLPAFNLLKEFEDSLGVREGLKAFWGLIICHTSSHAKELHEIMRKSLLKMSFRNKGCILNYTPEQNYNDDIQIQKKYSYVFKKLIKRIIEFLRGKKDVETMDERHLNQIISNFYEIDISDMLQGWKLKTYVSPESREHILQVFFCDDKDIEKNFVKIFSLFLTNF